MKLLLTSFGLNQSNVEYDSELFYRMPPVSMSELNQGFLPDYSVLLLADQVIIDRKTFDILITGDHDVSYIKVSNMIRELYDEGFIQIEDYENIVTKNHILLDKMLSRDLKELELWVNPLMESIKSWHEFVQKLEEQYLNLPSLSSDRIKVSSGAIRKNLHLIHSFLHINLRYHEVDFRTIKSKKSQKILKSILSQYLSYVNANILLSEVLNAGFHDWHDFSPFYREKFIRVAKEFAPGQKEIECVKKLFEVSFPEFSFWRRANVIKALKDRRIKELRQLIDLSYKGEVEFDKEFANRVLSEVFKKEKSIARFRNILSYATIPLDFIPYIGTPIQKVAEEIIAKQFEKKKRKGYQWFYLISELAPSPKK